MLQPCGIVALPDDWTARPEEPLQVKFNLLTPEAHGKLSLPERFRNRYKSLLEADAILIDRDKDCVIDRAVILLVQHI